MLIKTLKTNGFTYLGIYDRLLTKWGCKRLISIMSLKLQLPLCITFKLLVLLNHLN
jgi:hypothetical protein